MRGQHSFTQGDGQSECCLIGRPSPWLHPLTENFTISTYLLCILMLLVHSFWPLVKIAEFFGLELCWNMYYIFNTSSKQRPLPRWQQGPAVSARSHARHVPRATFCHGPRRHTKTQKRGVERWRWGLWQNAQMWRGGSGVYRSLPSLVFKQLKNVTMSEVEMWEWGGWDTCQHHKMDSTMLRCQAPMALEADFI